MAAWLCDLIDLSILNLIQHLRLIWGLRRDRLPFCCLIVLLCWLFTGRITILSTYMRMNFMNFMPLPPEVSGTSSVCRDQIIAGSNSRTWRDKLNYKLGRVEEIGKICNIQENVWVSQDPNFFAIEYNTQKGIRKNIYRIYFYMYHFLHLSL